MPSRWGIDPVECARRIATTRRGGYCFQLNSAFCTLLTELGYQVSLTVAGVCMESGPDKNTLLNHTTIIAEGLPSDASPSGGGSTSAWLTPCTAPCHSSRATTHRGRCGSGWKPSS
ncbi:arylamine N-acetyltransferase [Streptomyces sp. enrichment culture]|uniref:arylamine N-acetyltransferase n=1 Tax=Streptomyces sp. enrichment culture TaxID=1795815 RepID=UPI003F55BE40